MASANEGDHGSCTEVLEAHAHIWNQTFSFIRSQSLKCAVQLGIPDIIHNHGRPMTLSALVSALQVANPTKAHCVHRLMRILVHSGFFVQREADCQNGENEHEVEYLLTPASRLLLKDHPLSMSTFVVAMFEPIMLNPWHFLSTWFQNDATNPFEMANGRTLYEYAAHDPMMNAFFNKAMACDSRLVESVVLKDCKGVFEGLKSLVDVGGGTGTMAKAIAQTFPQLSCTVFDLPHVVANLQGTENLNFIAGNMFDAVPPADAILLKWILHDYNDEECLKILKNCRKSIAESKKGKVIVIDMVLDDKNRDYESVETQLFFDMLVMALLTGKQRNEKEWKKLFLDAGFSGYKISPVLGLRSLIEVYP